MYNKSYLETFNLRFIRIIKTVKALIKLYLKKQYIQAPSKWLILGITYFCIMVCLKTSVFVPGTLLEICELELYQILYFNLFYRFTTSAMPIKTPPPSNIGSHADPLHSQSRAFTAFSITNPLLPSFENPFQRTPFSNKYLWWRFSEAAKQNKAPNWKELFHLQGILSVCPMLVIGYWKSFHRCQETRWLHGRLTWNNRAGERIVTPDSLPV